MLQAFALGDVAAVADHAIAEQLLPVDGPRERHQQELVDLDDATIHPLNDQVTKKRMVRTASNPRLPPFNLINCNVYD